MAFKVDYQLQGLPGFTAALKQAETEIKRKVSLAEEATAIAVRDHAKANLADHTDTGDLQREIITTPRSGPVDLSWTVGVSDAVYPSRTPVGSKANRVHERPFIYGHILEHGSRKQPARPFMRPAADVELARFDQRILETGLLA